MRPTEESSSPRRFNFIWISPTPDGSIKALTLHRYSLQSHTHYKVPPVHNPFLFKPQKNRHVWQLQLLTVDADLWPQVKLYRVRGREKNYSNIIWITGGMESCLSLSSACVLNASMQPHVNSVCRYSHMLCWKAKFTVLNCFAESDSACLTHTHPLSHAHIALTSLQL